MSAKVVAHIKLEPIDDSGLDTSKIESPCERTTSRRLEAPDMTKLSAALISPGFSMHVLTNERARENLRQSVSVKNKQQDIIQQRLNEPLANPSTADVQFKSLRKQPTRLSLDSSDRVERAHQTAPLQGLMQTPRVYCQVPCQYQHMYPHPQQSIHQAPYQYYHHQQPLLRRHSRPSPYERPSNLEHGQSQHPPKTPGLAPLTGRRLTPPQSANHGESNSVRVLDSAKFSRQPITPPTERPDEGLTTLSRAARLKTMKESYMQACSDSFDALHGLDQ